MTEPTKLGRSLFLFCLAAFLAEAVLLGILNLSVNSDLFLGLARGRDALNGVLAQPDQWSFTAANTVWVDQSWLSGVFFYTAHKWLGALGPALLKALLLIGVVAISLIRSVRLGSNPLAALFAVAAGTFAAAPFFNIRAENFGLLYFVLFTLLIAEGENSPTTRRIGIPLLMTVWANSHGSFILGLGILGLKSGLCVLRAIAARRDGEWKQERDSSPKLAVEWIVILLQAFGCAALFNPYGTDNILMPFTQVGTGLVTGHSADWLPLISRRTMMWFTGPGTVYFYLIFLVFFLACSLIWLSRDTEAHSQTVRQILFRKPDRVDWVWELCVAVITIALAFRFKRMALFSSFALIPIASVVFGQVVDAIGGRCVRSRLGHRGLGPKVRAVLGVATLIACIGAAWMLYRVSFLPLSNSNPLRPARPLARNLMSFDKFSPDLVRFINLNHIEGKTLAGWHISSYLLWRAPGLRLFMDTRDQSFYPNRVIRDFFILMGIRSASDMDRLALAEKYGVENAVLTTEPYDFDLARLLISSGKWVCAYMDDYSIVVMKRLARASRDRDGDSFYGRFEYIKPWHRTYARAVQSYLAKGAIEPDLIARLKGVAQRRPWPNLYTLIAWGDGRGCFSQGKQDFLRSEAGRLRGVSPLRAHGAEEITQSLVTIYSALAADAGHCGAPKSQRRFKILEDSYSRQYETLWRLYSGRVF